MKRILLILILSGFACGLNAQRFHGGVMSGLVVSQLDGDNLGGYNKPGLRFGGWVNTRISRITTLQMELEFIQKGSKISENELEIEQYYHSRLHYIQLPLLAKFQMLPQLHLETGIAGAYLFKSLEDSDGYGFVDPLEPFDQYELSLIIGLGYEFSDHFFGLVRLNYSALPIREHPGGQVHFINRGQYNNALCFSLYYQID